jgi:flagellar biosynthesis chaperone FliJ
MAPFRYRLQPLLDEKISLKERAAEALAERQKEVRAEERKLEDLQERERGLGDRKAQFRRGLLAGAAGAFNGRDAALRRDYLRGLDQDAEDARDACFSQKLAVEESAERLAEAQRELAERSREVEILEKHRRRLEQRFLREAERKEALEQDEIGNMLYMSRRRAK